MSGPVDPIAEAAFAELMIACHVEGCPNVFELTLRERASDPVMDWADRMAKLARDEGWSALDSGIVVCPAHALTRDTPR
jgi:hypothetical protein